jgi:hypothetical protein
MNPVAHGLPIVIPPSGKYIPAAPIEKESAQSPPPNPIENAGGYCTSQGAKGAQATFTPSSLKSTTAGDQY